VDIDIMSLFILCNILVKEAEGELDEFVLGVGMYIPSACT
jgi:hypothetical protein